MCVFGCEYYGYSRVHLFEYCLSLGAFFELQKGVSKLVLQLVFTYRLELHTARQVASGKAACSKAATQAIMCSSRTICDNVASTWYNKIGMRCNCLHIDTNSQIHMYTHMYIYHKLLACITLYQVMSLAQHSLTELSSIYVQTIEACLGCSKFP